MVSIFRKEGEPGSSPVSCTKSLKVALRTTTAVLAGSLLFPPSPVRLQAQSGTTVAASSASLAQQAYTAGMALVRQGRLDDALRTFDKGLESDNRNLPILDAIGATLILKGDFQQAKGYFLDTLQIDPQFLPARKNLAITYFNLNEYDLASAEFQKLAAGPAESQRTANLFLGIIAEKTGDCAKSIALLGQSGALADQYPQVLISLAACHSQQKESAKALAALERLDTSRNVIADEYFRAGQLYSQLGQDQRALTAFAKAEQGGAHPDGLDYQRAMLLDRMGRSPEALEILKKATSAKPDSDSLNLLAHLAEKNQQFELALKSLRQAAKLAPAKEENYLDFSAFCADYENFPLALQAAEIGLEHVPSSYRLMVQKGAVLEKLARLDEAETVLRRAATLQDDNSVALLSLAIVQSHAEKLHDSVDTLTSAIARFPNNYYMHYYLGYVLLQIMENDGADATQQARAIDAFRAAMRLNPAFADSYYQLSKVYAQKSPKLAEESLIACLRVDPHHASAEYALARLYMKTGRQAQGQALIDQFENQQREAKLKEQNKPRIAAVQQ